MTPVTRRVAALTAAQVALAAALVALGRANAAGLGAPSRVVGLAAAFALVGLLPMHLELGRSTCTITLVEAVLVLALFSLGPLGVVTAAAAGEAVACLTHRQRLQKTLYNAVTTGLGAAIAALAFAALAAGHPHGSGAWGAALLAVACYAVWCHAATSLVLAVIGEGSFDEVFLLSAGMAAAAAVVSGAAGLALQALSAVGYAAPFLLVPLLLIVGLDARRAAALRADQLRFERLAGAAARTTGLQGFVAAMAQAATEARTLVTGSSALCCAPDATGEWRGVYVDDHGAHVAPPAMVASVAVLVDLAAGSEVATERLALAPARRAALPSSLAVVVAGTSSSGRPPPDGGIALAVFRNLTPDGNGPARAKMLSAFVFHAALITTNALLFERVEEALRRQMDLNRQKDEFLAAVSHELRTPLASMLGSVETLRRLDGRLGSDGRERFFGIALRQGERLQRLIEDLLLTASVEHRNEQVVVEDVDLSLLLREIAEDLCEQADGRIVVRVDGAAGPIRTDGEKLRQVVVNLVENAAKYAPTGPIEVLAATGTIGDVERALVRVVDHGPGIAPTDRARAFDRFVQLDGSSTRIRGGTGLGLYLCAQITQLLGGSLTVVDTQGGGATFALSLPCELRVAETPGTPAVPEIPRGDAEARFGTRRRSEGLAELTPGAP